MILKHLSAMPPTQETLWHILARASWVSAADRVRAIADRLLEAGVALKTPNDHASDGVATVWALSTTKGSSALLDSHTAAVLEILMDPKYGWNWRSPQVFQALAGVPKIQAAVDARLLSASRPALQPSSGTHRPRI